MMKDYALQTVDQLIADDAIVARALTILGQRLRLPGAWMNSPITVKSFLSLKLGALEREVFVALWLDVKNRVIGYEELFDGTLAMATVYPREVVKAGLALNAAACVVAHNHPSGDTTPSNADHAATTTLKSALALVDIKLLDHIIVAGTQAISFVEEGYLY